MFLWEPEDSKKPLARMTGNARMPENTIPSIPSIPSIPTSCFKCCQSNFDAKTAIVASRTRQRVGERSGMTCGTSKRSETHALARSRCTVAVSRTSRSR
eukprot:1186797-Prorocentrum_minimum.AAC.1